MDMSKEQAQEIIDRYNRGERRMVNLTMADGVPCNYDLYGLLYCHCEFIVSGLTEDQYRKRIEEEDDEEDEEDEEDERVSVEEVATQQGHLESKDDEDDACTDTDQTVTTYL